MSITKNCHYNFSLSNLVVAFKTKLVPPSYLIPLVSFLDNQVIGDTSCIARHRITAILLWSIVSN